MAAAFAIPIHKLRKEVFRTHTYVTLYNELIVMLGRLC